MSICVCIYIACISVCISVYVYNTHTYRRHRAGVPCEESLELSLHKIMFHFIKALLWESIISLLPPAPAKPTLLQYYCTAMRNIRPPTDHPPPLYPYTIQYWRWQYRVKANMYVYLCVYLYCMHICVYNLYIMHTPIYMYGRSGAVSSWTSPARCR